MTYSEQKDLMLRNKAEMTINIVHDVYWATSGGGHKVTDEEFDALCSYVRSVYDDVEKSYTQLIADIVCDFYLDLGYGHKKDHEKLTLKQLKNHERTEEIVNIYCDKYYN